MSVPRFFERKIALLPVYFLMSILGYFFGAYVLYASSAYGTSFAGHMAVLLFLPLVQLLSPFYLLFALERPEFLISGLAGLGFLVFGVLFLKKKTVLWLVFFSISVFILSLRGFPLFGALMSV